MSLDDTLPQATAKTGLVAGGMVGRYTLERVLGEGGMGVVWAAHDPDLDRTIAIKLLRVPGASDALRKRLLREARAMARLKHPNVLTVYEVGTDRDRDYIAMELVDGSSLQEWLATSPSEDQIVSALHAAGRGLAAAHAAGLVHRDFKPHNVLRSTDGRVLVTDFGLARGIGDEPAPEGSAPRPIRPDDSVLDSPLTQTGTLIGTPAYMAPEQFVGAEPDPRTDQFAYCVSAWQMLTGSRPYTADSIAELKFASQNPVRLLADKLPRRVRAALERGLDPDPQKRWRSLDELLEALERARRRSRFGPLLAIQILALAVAIVVAVMIARRHDPASAVVVPAACKPAPAELAPAWSAAVRKQLFDAHGELSSDQLAAIAASFDDFTRRWTTAYDTACKAPRAPHFDDRVSCLLGMRDRATALSAFAIGADKRARTLLEQWPVRFTLPDLEPCTNDLPIVPPRLPEADPQRANALAALGDALALPARDDADVAIKKIEGRALAVGWKPLPGIVLVAIGQELLARGQVDAARQAFARAIDYAQAERDARDGALARIGLFECSLIVLESPLSTSHKKGGLHEELERLLHSARSAVHATGDEPRLAAQLDLDEATAQLGVAQWNRYRGGYRDALARLAEAHDIYERLGDVRRVAHVYAREAEVYLARGDEHALDDAEHMVRTAMEALARAQLDPDRDLAHVAARIAFAQGKYEDAAVWNAMTIGEPLVGGGAYDGTLVDDKGAPVAGRVWAWLGELHGDPVNLVTNTEATHGTEALAPSGTFSFDQLPDGTAVIGQGPTARSLPTPARADKLHVAAPMSIDGTVIGQNLFEVHAIARYTIGANAWIVHAAVKRDGTFRLDNLPRGGAPVFGLIGPAGTGTRQVRGPIAKLAWPVGQTLDVIVHHPKAPGTVWVLRGKHVVGTRTQLEALAAREANVARSELVPIGAENTDAASDSYRSGDRHAVITGNADGDITACVAIGTAMACIQRTIKSTGLPYSDGRFGADVTPIEMPLD